MLLNINYLWEIKLYCFWIKVHVSSLVSKWLFGWVHSWNPSSFIKWGGGVWVSKIFQKEEVVKTSSIKREGLVGFTYFHTNPFRYHLYMSSLSTIFISIFCVSEKGLCLTESNHQICDFCIWVIFEKQRYWWPL